MKNHFFLAQTQQVFFFDNEQTLKRKIGRWWSTNNLNNLTSQWLVFSNSSGIDDGVPWLNTPMTHPLMLQKANLVGAKKLSAKELIIINSTFAHLP